MQIGHLLAGVNPSAPRSFEPLPPGIYTVIVSDDAAKTSKYGDTYISMEYTVIDGEFNNRRIWENMNIGHNKSDVAGRALADLKALACAVGIPDAETTGELKDIPFQLKVGQRKSSRDDAAPGAMEQTVQGYIAMDIPARPGRLPAAPAPAPIRRTAAAAQTEAPAPAPAPAPARARAAGTAPAAPPWAVKRA